ncbi:aminotransferase class IV [Flaviaesturariibacter amylovorans]|uniref:branched-chain-amino-acid transaminase n=1 Tax=Flaviaesturariibacter amylovorans TaxID=1084520 RepID=A0ABP8H3G3_9BACT
MAYIYHNGTFHPAEAAMLPVSNPAFCFGEGLFETMRLGPSGIPFWDRHMERLRSGMERLGWQNGWAPESLYEELQELVERNRCTTAARIRLTVYRAGDRAEIVGEARPLEPADAVWNERGFQVEVYPDARKAADAFSALKLTSYLPYLLASRRAGEQGLDECLVLNAWGNVCETGRMNLFIVRGNEIATPALSEGCIDGVLRRYLIEQLAAAGTPVLETTLTMEDLLAADELFLTNAVKGIRWVERFRNRTYSSRRSKELYAGLRL